MQNKTKFKAFSKDFAQIPKYAIHHTGQFLYTHKELPDWVSFHNPKVVSSLSFEFDYIALASDYNQIIHSQSNLLLDKAPFIYKHLIQYDKVNIYDLMETKGLNATALMLDFVENHKMGYYIPVTSNQLLNNFAIRNVNSLLVGLGLSEVETDSIQADMHLVNFKAGVLSITRKQQQELAEEKANYTNNLFILLNSSLGNAINPTKMLYNIYNSMNIGDHFLIVQSIYKHGQEDVLALDYQSLISSSHESFGAGKEMVLNINPDLDTENEIISRWVETDDFKGVKYFFKTFKEVDFAGVNLPANQEIAMFRLESFPEEKLKRMIRSVGFKILEISYDEDENNALILMKK